MVSRVDIKTISRVEFQEITSKVREIVGASGIRNGVCYIFVPHTTAGVTVNEHADPSVTEDIAAQFEKIAPQNSNYRHLEGNAPAHIKTSLVGSSEALFIEDGKLVLGTWQGIFFCEFDGPRNRQLLIKIMPETN